MNDEAPDVHEVLSAAQVCRVDGRHAEAKGILTELVARHPKHDRALQALAQLCMDTGDFAGAEKRWAEAALATPGNGILHKSLADAQEAQGNLSAAKENYRLAIAWNPDYFQAHANLANILLQERDTDAAIAHFQIAVELRPDIAELHDSLGRAFVAGGVPQLARMAFVQALRLKPTLATAHYHLADRLAVEGRLSEAIRHFHQARNLAPSVPAIKVGLANAFIEQGETDAASAIIHALEKDQARFLQGAIQRLHAKLARAEKRYTDALAIWRSIAKDAGTDDTNRRQAFINLAEIHDETGDYSAAFAALDVAHAIQPLVFGRDMLRDRVDRLISLYPSRRVDAQTGSAEINLQLVFVLGMPRSGKTLTEQLLALHPKVFGLDELYAVGALPLPNRNQAVHLSREAAEAALTDKEARQLARDFIDIAADYTQDVGRSLNVGITHLVSTVPGNIWSVPLILRMFPGARFIHVMRDPLDTCLACYFKEFVVEELRAHTNDLDSMGACYLEYRRMMSHWRDTLKIPMLEIHYEDLVTDPAATQARMYAELGLNPKDGADAKAALVPFSTAHIGHWKHYEAQLLPLINILGLPR